MPPTARRTMDRIRLNPTQPPETVSDFAAAPGRRPRGGLLGGLLACAAACAGCSPWSMPRWYTPEPWRMPAPTDETVARAVESPASPGGPLFLSVIEAVRLAFENNTNLRVQRLDPAIARTEIEFERAAFDPLVTASAGATGEREQVPPAAPTRTRGFDAAVALSGKLPIGTQWTFSYEWNESDSLTMSADHFHRAGVSVVQPLLRGFGRDANLAKVERATRSYELSKFQFEQAAMDVAAAVEHAYWGLVQLQLDLVVQLELLDSAGRRLESTRKRVELGAKNVDALDIIQDEAAISSRKTALLVIENAIEVQKLSLLRLINPKGVDGRSKRSLQTYVPYLDPEKLPPAPALEQTLRTALTERPELKSARIGEAIGDIDLRAARNELLPQLDLVGGVGVTGHAGRIRSAATTMLNAQFYDFDVALQYSWSIGNRAAASKHDKAELARARNVRTTEDVEQTVGLDVRLAIQRLDHAGRRYKQALENQDLQKRKLAMARDAFERGRTGFTLFFLLQFEDDLRNAGVLLHQTITDYLRALTDLRRAEGTILRLRGLKIE
jgi:outer membrane protein TolC